MLRRRIILFLFVAGFSAVAWYSFKYRIYIKRYLRQQYISIYNPGRSSGLTDFGIEIPKKYKVHGIDVSRWQQDIWWHEVKQMTCDSICISFAFAKATEGIELEDKYFSTNWKKMKEYGLIRGAYHFYLPNVDANAQARNFIKTVTLNKGDLPPVLDVEIIGKTSKKQLQKGVTTWLSVIEKHYKVKPIVYTNYKFYTDNLGDVVENYPLWIAYFYKSDLELPKKKKWHFWQHNDAGQVNGIAGFVDFNTFNGTLEELEALCIK